MERCTLEKNGFIGIYYEGTKSPEKAVIAAGGASCDEKTSVSMCRYLRNAGYNVLVLGFYLWKGLPKELVSIPVVPFDYVMEGTTQKGLSYKPSHRSQYTWHGEDVPYTPVDLLDELGMSGWLKAARKAEGYGLSRFMR